MRRQYIASNYLLPLSEYPSGAFDVVLNDGWARGHVAQRLDLLKPGGMFVWDNFETGRLWPRDPFKASRDFR